MTYPFDPQLREQVTEQLYGLLPELYRVRDLGDVKEPLKAKQEAAGVEELYRFLHVLATPLSTLRQNIEELHADLFVDSAADWALPYLARLIELNLIFPEASANRRDLRSAVRFRRRKGTLSALEALGNELLGRLVVSSEGFKRCFVSQDLDWLRPAHSIPKLTSALIAEIGTGPLDRLSHIVDLRPASRHTGRYHPRQIAHWLHATQLFPLREGAPGIGPSGNNAALDDRFTFDPLSRFVELRAQRTSAQDDLGSDRVRAEHFRLQPERYFTLDTPAQLCVRISGLPAAVAREEAVERLATRAPAHAVLGATEAQITLLARETSQRSDSVEIALVAVPVVGLAPSSAGLLVRATATISAAGVFNAAAGSNAALGGQYVTMLRVRRTDARRGFFAGATLVVRASHLEAQRPSTLPALAIEGYLRGALIVKVPALWSSRDAAPTPESGRWFYVAADGSLYEAQSNAAQAGGAFADLPLTALTTLPPVLAQAGPPPAFPALAPRQSPQPLQPEPFAPERSPVVLHGGAILRRVGATVVALGAPPAMALTFALVRGATFEPFLRVRFASADPSSAVSFEALAPSGVATTAAAAQLAAAEVFTTVDPASGAVVFRDLSEHQVVVRFEAVASGVILPPCEVALTLASGRRLLVHLPELEAQLTIPIWSNSLAFRSVIVRIHEDGSTAYFGNSEPARASWGDVTPLRGQAPMVRRRLRQRSLCGWKNELVAPPHVPPTTSGYLDLDPEHGLFALASADTRPLYPSIAGQADEPRIVTVDTLEGYSGHVGSRPAFREPLLGAALVKPTRLVIGHGKFNARLRPELLRLPRHQTLAQALAAIQALPAHDEEVIQIEDSNTYTEAWLWPTKIQRFTIQAAEGERPVIRLTSTVNQSPVPYASLSLIGVGLVGANFGFPRCAEAHLLGVAVLEAQRVLRFTSGTQPLQLQIRHCLGARFEIEGTANLTLSDSMVDASGGLALRALDARVAFERCTVSTASGPLLPSGEMLCVRAQEFSASDSVFVQAVQVLDRFTGCVRYSRVAPGSETPRRHRVTEDEPRFVSIDRASAAHYRLSERCPGSIRLGAEDGGEMGAFHGVRLGQMTLAVGQRLLEFTPAGLRTGLIRID